MWLPTPIYERVPQYWLLLGLLFMSSGAYLGFDYSLSYVYFGVGVVCCVWGLWTYAIRLRGRQAAREEQQLERQLEQAERDKAASVDDGQAAEPTA